jgi:hypothetical protein
MAVDLANGVSTIPGDTVSISLLAIADGNNALGVTVPGQIVDSTINNAVFTLGDSFTDAIPNSHNSSRVTTRNIETGGGEACDSCLRLVFGVLSSDCGVVN